MSFIVIILTILILYYPTLSYGLVIDDIEWYARIRNGLFKTNPWLRLYGSGTFGLNVALDHAITLFLHIITCVLIYLALNPLTAMLYSCHPSNHQTAVWINGRRYALFTIGVLIAYMTHMIYLIPVIVLMLMPWLIDQYKLRSSLPYSPSNLLSILKCIWYSMIKLTGLHRPMFLYPYDNVASFVPRTQACAERYLTIPLILFLYFISQWQLTYLLVPIYGWQSYRLMPMYGDIQSFYDYHKRCCPTLKKLSLLRQLYPTINQ